MRHARAGAARRGLVSPLALVAVLVLGALAAVGLTSRARALAFEARTLGRVCARWSAEAALAEVRGALAEGQRVERVAGVVPAATGYSRAAYAATVVAGPGEQRVRAEGTCTSAEGRSVSTVIAVRFVLRANTWELATWSEGSPADLPAGP